MKPRFKSAACCRQQIKTDVLLKTAKCDRKSEQRTKLRHHGFQV